MDRKINGGMSCLVAGLNEQTERYVINKQTGWMGGWTNRQKGGWGIWRHH